MLIFSCMSMGVHVHNGQFLLNPKLTSSLSKMRPSKGRDMDHWLRQSSNMMMLSTVDNICCRISGCNSRMRKKDSLFIMREWLVFFFLLVRQRKRKVMMLSSVAQQPVHTIVSAKQFHCVNCFALQHTQHVYRLDKQHNNKDLFTESIVEI